MSFREPGSDVVRQVDVEAHGVFVTNQATFAGRMSVVPDAVNDDGAFEIGVLNARGRSGMLRLLSRLAIGRLPGEGEVTTLRATAASVEVDTPVRFFGDGEVLQYVEKLKELDVDGVESTAHAVPLSNVLREDEPRESLSQEAALSNAPKSTNGLFVVPKIVE